MNSHLGPLMIDFEGQQLSQEDEKLLKHPMVGGVILFARNIESPAQVLELTQSIRAIRPELLIAVDQEGGRVQRLVQSFTKLPPLAELSRLPADKQALAAFNLGYLMALEVQAVGIDFSFAPVLDVDDTKSTIIGDRAFSADPQGVVDLAKPYIKGMHEAGMPAVGKHFPGHGSVVADSHLELPIDERTFEDIKKHDLVPFGELSTLMNGVMPAHVVYQQVAPEPACFSKHWLDQVLRQDLGFQGVVFSDDLSMAGARCLGNMVERVQAALSAGCDMVLVCNDRGAALGVIHELEAQHQDLPNSKLEGFRLTKAKANWHGFEQSPLRVALQSELHAWYKVPDEALS